MLAITHKLIRALAALLFCAGPLAPAFAQVCATQGDRFLKNDRLPDVPPPSPLGVALIPGLCVGEAAFTVFQNVQGEVNLNEVSMMFAAQGGVQGNIAVVDVEFYDGITQNVGGRLGEYALGPQLWSLVDDGNSNAQVQSHAINTIDLRTFGPTAGQGPLVTVTSGTLVVAIRIDINQNGNCATGYFANVATDYNGTGANCPAPGVNGIDQLNGPPFDPATYAFPGLPFGTLCNPLNIYRGNWIIRACITEATPPALTTWQGFPQPGGAVLIRLNSAATPNDGFLTLIGGGISVGTVTPWGTWPIDLDAWTLCFLGACRGLLSNDFGQLDANGRAITTLLIPADPILVGSGLTWYASFFAFDNADFFQWTAIGAASDPIIIN